MEAASAIEQTHRDAAIQAVMGKAVETHPDFDGVHCIEEDCGDEIPAGRLALGKIRCIDCQAAREKRHVN